MREEEKKGGEEKEVLLVNAHKTKAYRYSMFVFMVIGAHKKNISVQVGPCCSLTNEQWRLDIKQPIILPEAGL